MARGAAATLDAAVILVAHDRWFLEAVTTATLELEAGRSTYFPGPWHVWRLEKAARIEPREDRRPRAGRTSSGSSASSSASATRSRRRKQAQAKLRQIEPARASSARGDGEHALLTRRARSLGFEFLKPARSGRTVVEARDLGSRRATGAS